MCPNSMHTKLICKFSEAYLVWCWIALLGLFCAVTSFSNFNLPEKCFLLFFVVFYSYCRLSIYKSSCA